MMEFESSRRAHHPYAVKNEDIDAPHNWPLAASNPNQFEHFAMNGDAGIYPPNYSRMATSNASYPDETENIEYGWATRWELVESGGQGLKAEQNGLSHAAANTTTYSTITTMNHENAPLSDAYGGLNAMSNLTVGFATNPPYNAGFEDTRLWQQQEAYPNAINNSIMFDDSKMAMAGNNSLGLFVSHFEPMKNELQYALPVQEIQVGPTPAESSNFGPDNVNSQAWLNDEAPQMGYTSLTARPVMDDLFSMQAMSEFPDLGDGTTSCCNPNIQVASGFQDTNIANMTNGLFTPGELGLSGSTLSFAVSPPPDDYQLSHDSREVSVAGNFESPRTPYSWDYNISPSPANGHKNMISGSQIEEILPNGHLEVISTVKTGQVQPTLDELIGNFDTNPKRQSSKRKRKAFSTEEKQKVNLVRESGACISCHARKVPCSADDVCLSCLKTTGDPVLAKDICLRRRLKETYIGVKVLHETLDDRKDRLRPLLASLTGDRKAVDLTVANTRLGYIFRLHLQVMKCTSSPNCRWKRLTRVNGIYVTRDVIHDQRYVIVPESLPTVDQFDLFGRKILSSANGSHSGDLTRYLDDFLLGYCQGSHPSRLQNFANSTLRVASLNRLVAYGFLNLYDGSYDLLDRTTGTPLTENKLTRRYVSETVHDQLRLLAAEGLEPTEAFVFSEVDNLNKIIRTGRNGRIVAGICILRLMLLYRDRMIRDSIRLGLPGSGERHQIRLGKAAFMYKRLTIVYGTLCRETTPLTMSWLPENETMPTGEDVTLTDLFSQLQPAFEEFCNEKLTAEYDYILKGLIIESPKIERRPSKKQKSSEKQSVATS